MRNRTSQAAGVGITRDSITRRLQQALAPFSLSEVARKTGTAISNVQRYLRGARVPSDFSGAIVRGFAINPAWLLTGEGAQSLSDAATSASHMAGDLLALVAAMNEVTRMKLGALAGKGHLSALRDLNDALAEFERLRKRLDGHTRPVFKTLLDDYYAALKRRNLPRADDLRSALGQVNRLCPDHELGLHFARAQSMHAFVAGEFELSLSLQRDALLRELADGKGLTADTAIEAANLSTILLKNGKLADSAAIAGASLALLARDPALAMHRAILTFIKLFTEILQGKLGSRIGPLLRAYGRFDSEQRRGHNSVVMFCLLFEGALDPLSVFALGPRGAPRTTVMLLYARWTEDIAILRHTCAEAASKDHPPMPSDPPVLGLCSHLLEALEHARPRRLLEFRSNELLPRRDNPVSEKSGFEYAVQCAQAARVAGDLSLALKDHQLAEKLLRGLPKDVIPQLLFRGTHHRTALALADATKPGAELRASASRARKFFTRHVAQGYGCFFGMAKDG